MKFLQILVLIVVFSACNNKKDIISDKYRSEIDVFFEAKMKERQDDYLQLVALHKLNSGNNTLGKSNINDLILNIESLPETIGSITIQGDSLSFNAKENIIVTSNNDSIITRIPLLLNEYGSSLKMHHNEIRWQVITRSGQHYLRVWYSKNPAVKTFKGFKKFDLNSDYILDGEFTYFDKEKSEVVKAKVDGKRSINFIGSVSFTYQDKTFSLDVSADGFTMVGDITNGDTTYGGGRYFYLDLPKESGLIKIDFNKLYNPPCAFSEFTTCLYPPRQNQLPFKILAGETINRF
ncbi:DUF1684 domain-containing protein [Pontimicrobium aquaticum]|uniref:DUF1684 domain-containing protein n=1 Tax=Pontimicrobium aquaticum TaxID=2565367 RepID=A0A4V5LQP7_9FLAO|nr:DUF1684 domain-containing protein [Pontimicrobium aquaticum]TJY36209.1 DUF1684 domain-containing protein [Pontimicrobium aquaticum]